MVLVLSERNGEHPNQLTMNHTNNPIYDSRGARFLFSHSRRKNTKTSQAGLLELEVLSVITPDGICHTTRSISRITGLSLQMIEGIERQALDKIRNSEEIRPLLEELDSNEHSSAA